MARVLLPLCGLVLLVSCASAPPPLPPVVLVPYETKVAAILRLEDHRVLADEHTVPLVPAPVLDRRGRPLPAAPAPMATDLITLLEDEEPRVRRRAALGIGRVGLREGVDPLARRLAGEPDAEVRAMSAFALGLIGDASAVEPLVGALDDASPLVRGRAAQAIGLIGPDGGAAAAAPVARMVAGLVDAGALAVPPPDEPQEALSPEADAIRRGLTALAALKSYDGLATAVLDAQGRPRSSWWPIAFALSRVEDDRAIPALRALIASPSTYTVAHALRGLGDRRAMAAIPDVLPLLEAARDVHPQVRVSAVRAVARIGAAEAATPLIALLAAPGTEPMLRLEVVDALGTVGGRDAEEALIDRITDRWPLMRAAVLRALVRIDADMFTTILSGLDPDGDWRVRAALAEAVSSLPVDRAQPTLERLRGDQDLRVVPAVLRAMAAVGMPGLEENLRARLQSDDPAIRTTTAGIIGERGLLGLRPDLIRALEQARTERDSGVRWAVLDALGRLDAASAVTFYEAALADPDWSVRLRAARWLEARTPDGSALDRIRPAPTGRPVGFYEAERLVAPKVSPHAFIDTPRGSIEIELAVLDAPLTVDNFITLARQGYFNGLQVHRVVPNFVVQDGDPRGDGTGGPGYTIRDELHDGTYGRGVVGMALAGPDTGGSQWFITHSAHPHLDGRYTIFGRVTAGMELVDSLQVGDTVTRIRIWDGVEMR
jgi:cyclophilin family peptidyl-prolyl cis-trans isomerase/HEAT repeat protein